MFTDVVDMSCSASSSRLLHNAQVIGSGGFGLVLRVDDKAVKLLHTRTSCSEAHAEFLRLHRMDAALEQARKLRGLDSDLQKALDQIKPVKALHYWSEPFEYQGEHFTCGLVTSFAVGARTSDLLKLDPSITEEYASLFPRILVMPSSQNDRTRLDVRDRKEDLSKRNPPRYFVMGKEAVKFYKGTFDFSTDFPCAMGVFLAVATFYAKLVLVDVEILLGDPADKTINVMDLGMCHDIVWGDANHIAGQICDISGPFYTKAVFPLPDQESAYAVFTDAFKRMGVAMGRESEFMDEVISIMSDML